MLPAYSFIVWVIFLDLLFICIVSHIFQVLDIGHGSSFVQCIIAFDYFSCLVHPYTMFGVVHTLECCFSCHLGIMIFLLQHHAKTVVSLVCIILKLCSPAMDLHYFMQSPLDRAPPGASLIFCGNFSLLPSWLYWRITLVWAYHPKLSSLAKLAKEFSHKNSPTQERECSVISSHQGNSPVQSNLQQGDIPAKSEKLWVHWDDLASHNGNYGGQGKLFNTIVASIFVVLAKLEDSQWNVDRNNSSKVCFWAWLIKTRKEKMKSLINDNDSTSGLWLFRYGHKIMGICSCYEDCVKHTEFKGLAVCGWVGVHMFTVWHLWYLSF